MKLRRLFELRGFQRIRVGKFEDYGLYVENKNFLQSDQIITFMDMDGRLLALKPDMTLSVVKNIASGKLPTFQKLYYVDEVYRASRERREYRAVNQIGVELVGELDSLACLEVVDLALTSLSLLDKRYLLDLSHLGFVSGLFRHLGISDSASGSILAAIHAKRLHDIGPLLEQAGAPEAREAVLCLAQLHGDVRSSLETARGLIRNDEMRDAWDELNAVAQALAGNGFRDRINLDFSVVNDLDYYNGLIFQGYVEGAPLATLNGGRYDNLLHRMGKESGAIGFAILLDELKIHRGKRYDFDLLIYYEENCDRSALLNAVHELTGRGIRVRLERDGADLSQADFRCERCARFGKDRLQEEGEWKPC